VGMKEDSTEKAGVSSAAILARLARERFQSDIGIGIDSDIESIDRSVTGQAYIAINYPVQGENINIVYPSGSHMLARRAVMQTLFSLRQMLLAL
jgi:nicotinamide mononucleotide (NMN) deamidase PncC